MSNSTSNLTNSAANTTLASPDDTSSSVLADSTKQRSPSAADHPVVSIPDTGPDSSHRDVSSTDDPARDPPSASSTTDFDHPHDSPPALTADNSSTSPENNDSPAKVEPGGFILNGSEDHTLAHGAVEPDPDTIGSEAEIAASQMSDSHSQSSADGEGDWSSDGFEPDLRRVKVYELIGSRWSDRGTAFCQGNFDNESQEAKLIARSETDSSDVLLACTIRSNDIYQRQQDTLIVWTEPDGTDFALSFQDAEGCAEVWEFITDVQRHLNSKEDALSSPLAGPNGPGPGGPGGPASQHSVTTQQIIQSGRLPNPQMGIIGEIEKAIRALARTPTAKERVCEYILQEEYVNAMIDVFRVAEELENVETLHALCSCMQTILLLNDHTMFEHILSDELWLGAVGMLEYDPEFPTYKANYREFLCQNSRFLQPIAIEDPSVQRKVHQTYRLQYLKDVILARALDDSTFNVLNSCIIFNQIDIINHVQSDERFLSDVVGLFIGGDSDEERKKKEEDHEKEKKDCESMDVDPQEKTARPVAGPSSSSPSSSSDFLDLTERRTKVILLVQQLCAMGKNVQLPARIALFRTLVNRGILHAVQWALSQPDKQMISTAGEILAVVLEHDTAGVRAHVLRQAVSLDRPQPDGTAIASPPDIKGKDAVLIAPPFKESILDVMCSMMAASGDLALQNQFADSLRTMLEVPQEPVNEPHPIIGPRLLSRPRDDPGTERFLEYFYKGGVFTLMKPLTNDVPDFKSLNGAPLDISRERANLYLYLCDLLCSFALQHSFRSHFFILSSNASVHVASLLNVRDKHLCLAALRFFRICLKLNNRNLFNHLMKADIIGPVISLTERECHRDNLLTSTCQEFFDYMRKENIKEFIQYTMTKYEARLRHLVQTSVGSKTFVQLISRWEINNEPPPKEPEKTEVATPNGARRWGQGRLMESEEEDYFNNSDEDDSVAAFIRNQTTALFNPPKRKRLRLTMSSTSGSLSPRPPNGPLPPRAQSPLSSLLDYDEDDDIPEPGPHPSDLPKPIFPDLEEESLALPDSPILPHRQIQILPAKPPEGSDPEDDLLEALVNGGRHTSSSLSLTQPTAGVPRRTPVVNPTKQFETLSMPPMRQREKRRREDEDDDELLERLISKGKRPSTIPVPESSSDSQTKVAPAKNGDEGPKKFKLKFTMSNKAATSNNQKPSSPLVNSTKDGDGG